MTTYTANRRRALEQAPPKEAKKVSRDGLALAGFIGAGLAVGAVGGMWTSHGLKGWYQSLKKPAFTPPSWVFGPVWTTLYVLMGVSAWLLWKRREEPRARLGLALWGAQLGENLAWSGLFFDRRSPAAGLVDIGLLWGTLGAYTATAWPVSKPAALLFTPYLGWVTYAGALNEEIWRLNR